MILLKLVLLLLVSALPTDSYGLTCGPYSEVEERCTQYTTSPFGGLICAPGKMEQYCRPITTPDPELDFEVRRCAQKASTCVDTTPVKHINGATVPISAVGGCWKWDKTFMCVGPDEVNTCQQWEEDPRCSVFSRKCLKNDSNLGCMEWESVYNCITERGTSREIEVCDDTNVCVGGICWDTSYPPDQDFAQVVTDMEIARQVGVYSPEGLDIFSGTSDVCRSKRAAGLKNCCGTSTEGQGKSNNAMMGEFLAGAGGYAVRAGSKYVFDTLYGDTINWLGSGMSAAIGSMPGGTSFLDSIANPSFSYFGFSIGGTGQFLGTTGYQLIGSSGGFPGMYFNPYAFAAAIAIQVIMEAMTCSEEEAMLGMKRGAGLCSPKIGDWCDKEILGVCITRKQSYCCYNSKFARLINVEGRKQLGMGWGNTKSPSCNGFTASQLAEIDFSRIDMSELINDVMKAVDTSFLNLDRANAGSNLEDHADKVLRDSCAKVASKPNLQLPPECEGVL